ncbi:MAG: cysteine desulfurase [Bacteroidales bacterium]|nr:cysteine desulfurase [Bacteroidales bacterium]
MYQTTNTGYNLEKIRKDFPILQQEVNGSPLVYFDNAATTQKPLQVINAITDYYHRENSNVHRGVHRLSVMATESFENVRQKIAQHINARYSHEIVFTRGTTESINLVASTWGKKNVKKGDQIIISAIEHHSNIVPWQMLCEEVGARLRIIPVDDAGEMDLEAYRDLFNEKTRLVAVNHISNTLGTINPVKEIVEIAHDNDIPVLIDGAQGLPHGSVDVQDLHCEFYCFSGHKVYGPTGIGGLYGKEKFLEEMPPYQGGGEMIKSVTFEKTDYNDIPYKFEAGTPNVAGVIGFGAALDYINNLGLENIKKHEDELMHYATTELEKMDGITIIGKARNKASVISLLIGDIHPYDAGTIIDHFGVAVRTGNHCTQPIMDHYGIPGTVRASFGLYNTKTEIETLLKAINKVKEMFG